MSSSFGPGPATGGQLSGVVPMYVSPEPLNAQQHAGLGVHRSDTPFRFAATVSAVPLQVTEFGPAGISYPIIFAGDEKTPLVVMSIRSDENLFVDAEGRFEPEAYIPAFVRRYPFVLANDPDGERMVVCIDKAATFLNAEGEIKLFEAGEPTEYTRNAIQFCQDFENERVRTESFVKRLKDLDLFETRQANFTPQNPDGSAGEPVQVAEYFAVAEAKVNALAPEVLVELRDTGALRQIYAHLDSIYIWDRLITRTVLRFPATEGTA